MNELISRRPEWQSTETARPSWPPRETISRAREQSEADEPKPESRGYQMGEPMKESQQG